MKNAIDRLQHATLRLSQDGTIKDRLADAYTAHLVDLAPDDLPAELRDEFNELNAALHSVVPQPRECAVRASVRKMSNQQAGHLATLVVLMFIGLVRAELGAATNPQRATRGGNNNGAVVQLFAEA
jgi:hypothetical protein